jgi:hypothetical protein
MSWHRKFAEPIELRSGKNLTTLHDAALYITRLPKSERDAKEWQAAAHCLIEAADHGGPILFARLGVMRAMNRHVKREFGPSRKDKHSGRQKLAGDR